MSFLTVYTPTFRRPTLLTCCVESVDDQTEVVEHVVVFDEIGIGIGGVYKAVRDHVGLVHGDYVMVLSDDNVLLDEFFAHDLHVEAELAGFPDVVVFKGLIESITQPLNWAVEPVVGGIDLSCFAVRREVWCRHADCWGDRYEGDFDFIHSLWDLGYSFHWWDRLGFRALQISRGAPE